MAALASRRLGGKETIFFRRRQQGCQMVQFRTKNPNFGKILEGLAIEDVSAFY
jgi:hypothetical protein